MGFGGKGAGASGGQGCKEIGTEGRGGWGGGRDRVPPELSCPRRSNTKCRWAFFLIRFGRLGYTYFTHIASRTYFTYQLLWLPLLHFLSLLILFTCRLTLLTLLPLLTLLTLLYIFTMPCYTTLTSFSCFTFFTYFPDMPHLLGLPWLLYLNCPYFIKLLSFRILLYLHYLSYSRCFIYLLYRTLIT